VVDMHLLSLKPHHFFIEGRGGTVHFCTGFEAAALNEDSSQKMRRVACARTRVLTPTRVKYLVLRPIASCPTIGRPHAPL
jgi:hypothetical protein